MPLSPVAARAAALIKENKWYEATKVLAQSADPELAMAARMCQDISEPNETDKQRVLDLLDVHAISRIPPTNTPEMKG